VSPLRKFGYKPSKRKGPHIRHLLAPRLGVALPAAVSLAPYCGPVADQGQTGSCVGQAIARAIYIRQGVLGTPCAWPSPASVYTLARCIERGPTPVGLTPSPLQDDGCSPEDAFAGALQWGVARNDAWPFDPATIDFEPPFLGLEDALCCKLTGSYSVPCDSTAPELVQHSLAAGYPIVRGGACGDETQNYPGGDAIIGAVVNPSGGHETVIVG